jgi:TonB family protein
MSQASAHVDGNKQPADHRVHLRQPVRSLAYVELGEGNGGIVLNVSEGGIAVQAVMSLMNDDLPCVRIQLAHSKKRIEAKGRITWTAGLRKTAGVEFIDLSQEARSLLREWVALEAPPRELVQEMAEPIAKSDVGVATQHPFEPKDPRAVPAALAANSVATLAQIPSESERASKPVAHLTTSRESSDFNAAHAAPATVAPAALKASEVPWTAFPVRKTPAAIPTATPVTSAPLAAGSGPASPAARDEASSVPADRFGFKPMRTMANPSVPAAAPRGQRLRLPALVGIFAAVSLAAGWFAGHGALHGMFTKAANDGSAEDAAENSEALPPASPNASTIEVVDLNNRRWLVPMQGPLSQSRSFSPSSVEAPSTQLQPGKMGSDVALAAPISRKLQAAIGAALPVLAPASRDVESVLPASADSDSRPAIPSSPASATDQQATGLQSGELLHRVEPVYPPSALAQKVEGTVTLYAVIDTDGTVRTLQSLDGPSALIPSALAAVRQWRYSPSFLNGRPVQTERQIKIVFQLSQPQ